MDTIVDVESGDGRLDFSLQASDNDSGFNSVFIIFNKEITYSTTEHSEPRSSKYLLLSGGWDNNTLTQSLWISRFNDPGEYSIVSISIADSLYNSDYFSEDELTIL